MEKAGILELVGAAVRRALEVGMLSAETLRPREHGGDVFALGMMHPVSYRYRPPHGEAVVVVEGRLGMEAIYPVPRNPDRTWAEAVARKVIEYVRTEQNTARTESQR